MKIDTPKYILAIDCETSGLVSGKKSLNPVKLLNESEHYQALSWGVVVVDYDTFEPVDVMYREVQFNPHFTWSDRAERVHRLTQEHLNEAGVPEDEFVADFCELIAKYWGTSTPVIVLGHNPYFDIAFLRDTLDRYGIPIHFSNRVIDTNSLAMTLAGITGSDALFDYFSLPARDSHNALDDILMTLIAAKGFRDVYQQCLTAQ